MSQKSCFFCGGSPMKDGNPYAMCRACREEVGKSIAIVSIITDPPGDDRPSISTLDGKPAYPDGRYFAMDADAFRSTYGVNIEDGGMATMSAADFDKVMAAYEKAHNT